MKPVTSRDMENCYLIVEAQNEQKAGYQQKMVLHNQITGVLSAELRQVDAKCRYFYNITNKVGFCDYFQKNKLSADHIRKLFHDIIKVIQDAREFLLEQDNFILEKEYIYFDRDDDGICLCFFEGYHTDVRKQFLSLTEYFMEAADYKDEESVMLTYRLYKILRDEGSSFTMITEVLERKESEKQIKTDYNPEIWENSIEDMTEVEEAHKIGIQRGVGFQGIILALDGVLVVFIIKTKFLFYRSSMTLNVKHIMIAVIALAIFNIAFSVLFKRFMADKQEQETVLDYENEDTIVLTGGMSRYKLIGGEQGELQIVQFPYLIGSSSAKADGVVKSAGVSKQHAVLEEVKGEVHIKDLCSTNGTYVNGELITPMEPFQLKDGDKILLANTMFQFIKIS